MLSRYLRYFVALVLFAVFATPLCTQKKEKALPSSVTNGDPPPGNAMSLSIARARTVLKETLRSGLSRELKASFLGISSTEQLDSFQVWMRADGFDFMQRIFTNDGKYSQTTKVRVDFNKDQDYITPNHIPLSSCGGNKCFSVHRINHFKRKNVLADAIAADLLSCTGSMCGYMLKHDQGTSMSALSLALQDEGTAQKFADAFNRLVYAAHRGELQQESAAFSKAAADYRAANPKPPLSPEADNERILAENAAREKNLDYAAEHYQSALEIQPAWPTGWYNLATVYSEQQDYTEAADAMKHFLELSPDAPEAQSAREQMLVWDDKARQNPSQQEGQPVENNQPAKEGQTTVRSH